MPAPPVVATGQVIEHTLNARHFSQDMQILNRSYWAITGVAGAPVETLDDVRAALTAKWSAQVVPILSDRYELRESYGKLVSGVNIVAGRWFPAFSAGTVATHSTFGGEAGTTLPTMTSMSVRYVTTTMSRFYRGGVRLGPVPLSFQDTTTNNSKMKAVSLALVQAAITLWRTSLTTAGNTSLSLVIFSPTDYGRTNPLATPVTFTSLVNAAIVNEFFHTQRSRLAPHVP